MSGSSKPRWKVTLQGICLTVLITLILAAIFIPTLDGPDGSRRRREAVAVGNLKQLTALENAYATAHPGQGFSCELAALKPADSSGDDYDPYQFLIRSDYTGYRFQLSGCEADASGAVVRYRASAVPEKLGTSGVRSFCTNQTGTLWYDGKGSVEDCLTHRKSPF